MQPNAPIDFFINTVRQIDSEIDDATLNYLVSGIEFVSIKKGDVIISPEKKHEVVSFLISGFVKGFYIDPTGQEITTRLLKEGAYITDYAAFTNNRASDYYFVSIESCRLLQFSYQHIQQGYRLLPGMERFGRLIAENIITILETRNRALHFLNGEERYLQFIKTNADFVQRITQSDLASYLGLRPPSLSRIRKNIIQQKRF